MIATHKSGCGTSTSTSISIATSIPRPHPHPHPHLASVSCGSCKNFCHWQNVTKRQLQIGPLSCTNAGRIGSRVHTHVRTYIRTHIGGARSNPNGERIVHALICQLSKCRSVVVSACRFGGCCPNGKVTSEAEAGPGTKYNPPAPVPLHAPPPPPGRLALLLP